MKTLLVNVLKAALSIGLLAYLVHQVRSDDPETFLRLLAEPKRWEFLVAAWACFLAALAAGLTRWQRMAAAVGLDGGARQTLRIGVLAYMLDFAAFGAAGGDLFKALSLRRLHPGRGVHALTTVVADRLVGLGTLLVFASVGAWLFAAERMSGLVPLISRSILVLAGIGTLAALLLFALRRRAVPLAERIAHWPVLGGHGANLLRAVGLYGNNPWVLGQAVVLSLAVLSLNATGYALLAAGLATNGPSLAQHFLIVPLASLSGLVPLPADALGVLDYAMSYLYVHVTAGSTPASLGVMVVMTYRVVGVGITAVGLMLYLSSPGDVRGVTRRDDQATDARARNDPPSRV